MIDDRQSRPGASLLPFARNGISRAVRFQIAVTVAVTIAGNSHLSYVVPAGRGTGNGVLHLRALR